MTTLGTVEGRENPVGVWAAFAMAVLAAAGSVYLSVGLDLVPCPLCFYQRTLAFSAVTVLGVGLLAGPVPPSRLALLALPLAAAGLGVAAYHVSLEARNKLECPPGLFGLGTAPKQSLALFGVLTLLLLVDVGRGLRSGTVRVGGLVLAVALAGAAAWASCVSNPKMPLQYDYSKASPDICRPPKPPQSP
jgi:disulfide bond formation protein DsbB